MKSINFSQTRQYKNSVVTIFMKSYQAQKETIYLMQSQVNAKRLNRAIAQLENSQKITKKQIEEK